MSIPANVNPLLLAADAATSSGYQIERSLRCNSSDSAYLSWVPGTSATSSRKMTYSTWIKRSRLSVDYEHFGLTANANSGRDAIRIDIGTEILQVYFAEGPGGIVNTNVKFRDTSAWYHILVSIDTTQVTPSNRIVVYVNNVVQDVAGTQPIQNYDFTGFLAPGKTQNIGRHTTGQYYFSGYMANVQCIDGQALTPSSFTEVSATTGQLIPKAYTGTYGTNGFYLKFADNSTAAALGTDTSGNGNNWTPNYLSVTAGAGNDSLVDTPTSYGTDTGVGGEVRGNYALANALDNGGQTLANGNLDITGISSNWRSTRGTIGMSSGKWYWEITIGFTNNASNQSLLGIATGAASISGNYASAGAYGWEYYSSNGNKFNNGSNSGYGDSYTNGNVIGVAFDADAGSLTFYKNGSSQGTAYTGLTSGPYFPSFSLYGVSLVSFNAGQRAFASPAPSGFKALCDTNLTAPLIAKPSTVFDVITYTGTGSSLTLPNGSSTPTSISFTPDFAWLKGRSGATDHALYDAVRGVQKDLVSNSTSAETTETTGLTAFGTNTFTVGSLAKLNTSSSTYVAWAWYAGGSTVSNTAGSITSQVRANASAGFSVVTYTGTGSAATVGHGLGVAPSLIIVKSRSNASTEWQVYHQSLGINQTIQLNSTSAASTISGYWGSTAPSSTVFGLIGTGYQNNISGATYVAYCFAPVTGYSSFGSYTGNGSADGPFVYTGFRPRWIMVKCVDSAQNWFMLDTARNTYNAVNSYLMANSSSAEDANNSTVNTDFTSNGFKVRATTSNLNNNAQNYVFAAFAENPFQYARAR